VKKKQPIRRFPRLGRAGEKAYLQTLTKKQRLQWRVAKGDLPRGWDRLTKVQRRLIRLVLHGESVHEACQTVGVDSGTYYDWLNAHPLFRKYYFSMAQRIVGQQEEVDKRLDSMLPRAARVMEESLEDGDPYFRQSTAMSLLKGRRKLTTSVLQSQKVEKSISVKGEVKQVGELDIKVIHAFVGALSRQIAPPVIQVTPTKTLTDDEIKALPEATFDSTSVQKRTDTEPDQSAEQSKNG